MNPASQRRHLLDNALLYLFSFDVELDIERQEIGVVADGMRVNVFCRPNEARVYHVIRESVNSSAGFPEISGTIVAGGDWALIRKDDVAVSDVRMTIKTDDGAFIDARYRGIFPLEVGGYQAFLSDEDKIGTFKHPVEFPIVVTPTFETGSLRYRWLTDRQCVGFGHIQIIKNRARRVTYDIYGMD